MAGLQYCCRKLFICNSSRFINRNGTLFQPSRGRHHLVFHISSPQNRIFFQKSKLIFSTDRQQLIFRLASTNVNIPKESVSTTTGSESPAGENKSQLNSETTVDQSSNSNLIIDESHLPPAPAVEVNEVPVMEFVSTGLKEPSFESLGLGSWWPSGIIQQIYEYLHINLDMPWWGAIMLVTTVTRILMFPVSLSVRKDVVNMTNHMPQMAKYQEQITQARLIGDYYAVANTTQEMTMFMKEKKINILGYLKMVAIQGPVFISMFYALKGMANAPVESLKTGGLFWFTDLTATDPYYILPLVTSATLFCILEVGAEGNPTSTSTHTVKWLMRGMPVVIFFVTTRFPTCVSLYWTISNLLALCQTGLLKIPAVSNFFKLPKTIKHSTTTMAATKKGFVEGFKEGFSNARLSGQIEDRLQMNLREFQKAGTGAIPRTFKRNPLLQKEKK